VRRSKESYVKSLYCTNKRASFASNVVEGLGASRITTCRAKSDPFRHACMREATSFDVGETASAETHITDLLSSGSAICDTTLVLHSLSLSPLRAKIPGEAIHANALA
jgi:hypothetical protein